MLIHANRYYLFNKILFLFWQISPEEEERRRVRRERNKLAAAKCRQRRVDHTNRLIIVRFPFPHLFINLLKQLILNVEKCKHPRKSSEGSERKSIQYFFYWERKVFQKVAVLIFLMNLKLKKFNPFFFYRKLKSSRKKEIPLRLIFRHFSNKRISWSSSYKPTSLCAR